MVWVRIDDAFTEHPKVAAAGPLAIALQVAALGYCNRNLTDGFIPSAKARGLMAWDSPDANGNPLALGVTWSNEMFGGGWDVDSAYVIGILIEAGMWEEVPGGYRVHDFEDYQPSRADVEERRKGESKRKAQGGRARADGASRNPDGTFAKPAETAGQNQDIQQPSSPVPVPEPLEEDQELTRAASPYGPTDQQLYLLRRLFEADSNWSSVTPGAIVKLNQEFGRPTVHTALGYLRESPPADVTRSTYGLLKRTCEQVREESTA